VLVVQLSRCSSGQRCSSREPTNLTDPTECAILAIAALVNRSDVVLAIIVAVATAQRLAPATRRAPATRSGATEEDVGATRVREVAAGIRSETGREISHAFNGSSVEAAGRIFGLSSSLPHLMSDGFLFPLEQQCRKIDAPLRPRYAVLMSNPDQDHHDHNDRDCGRRNCHSGGRCGPGFNCGRYGRCKPRALYSHVAGANACSTFANVLVCCAPRPRPCGCGCKGGDRNRD